MKHMSLHFKRLQGTLQMRTTCATCYDLFNHSTNSIGSNYRGERLIISSMVIETPKRDHHGASVTRTNFLMEFVLGPLRHSQERENPIIFPKKNYVILWHFYQTMKIPCLSQSTSDSTNVPCTKRNIGLTERTSLVVPIWWVFSM